MASSSKVRYPKREAERMLAAFERQIRDLHQFESQTEYTVGALNNDRYAKFRSRSGEIYTLGIVVKTRLDHLDTGPDQELNGQFDRLVVDAQKTIIQASLRFMDVLSKLPMLPLGAREIFTGELRALYDARERLRDPRYASYIDAGFEKKLGTAEAVLNTIIEKAPKLLSFSQD
jgi:hypothetical protein